MTIREPQRFCDCGGEMKPAPKRKLWTCIKCGSIKALGEATKADILHAEYHKKGKEPDDRRC